MQFNHLNSPFLIPNKSNVAAHQWTSLPSPKINNCAVISSMCSSAKLDKKQSSDSGSRLITRRMYNFVHSY